GRLLIQDGSDPKRPERSTDPHLPEVRVDPHLDELGPECAHCVGARCLRGRGLALAYDLWQLVPGEDRAVRLALIRGVLQEDLATLDADRLGTVAGQRRHLVLPGQVK